MIIDSLLAQLESSERQLLRRKYWDDQTQAEIAADLGVSQMQVSRLLQRALTHLRQLAARPPSPDASADVDHPRPQTLPPVVRRSQTTQTHGVIPDETSLSV